MLSVEIKAIERNDFDIWLPLWKGYQRFYEVDIPESVTLETWASRGGACALADTPNQCCRHAALRKRRRSLGFRSVPETVHLKTFMRICSQDSCNTLRSPAFF